MEVLFLEYFQSISRIFPFHGKHFRTMELDKTMELDFPTFFYNISGIFSYNGRGSISPVCGVVQFIIKLITPHMISELLEVLRFTNLLSLQIGVCGST